MLHFSFCQTNRSLDSQVALKKRTQVKNKQQQGVLLVMKKERMDLGDQ